MLTSSAPADQGSGLSELPGHPVPLGPTLGAEAQSRPAAPPAALCPHLDLDHVLFTNRRMSPHFGINTEVWLPHKYRGLLSTPAL